MQFSATQAGLLVSCTACVILTEMPKGKTRDERWIERKQHYLHGNSRYPYHHTPRSRLEPDGQQASVSSSTTTGSGAAQQKNKICANCAAVLSHYVSMFKGLTHQGSTLKQRKHKRPNLEYFRNVKLQSEWLRENLFDPMGNYLICAQCICASFKISERRLTCQKNVKRQQSQHPVVTTKKV